MSYSEWFEQVAGFAPHPWQRELGEDPACRDRLLRIPTGFGKTAGTTLAWVHHRIKNGDRRWPARLVFCLPMRVLVEQTERAIEEWLHKAGCAVPVVVLLGGRRESGWLESPERPVIVVGTQDMLLSRALARGYGSSRGLWPMEMGLLHSDALWVVDEVQLMDVGLATTAQLHAFRNDDADGARPVFRPSFSWWMSATLQPRWLDTVDLQRRTQATPISTIRIGAPVRQGGLWDVSKTCARRADVGAPEEVATLAKEKHLAGTRTLVMVNTVDRARKVFEVLQKAKLGAQVDLVHSRFRGAERAAWNFLSREAPIPAEGRILVATQVVEAGVDLSAATLITDLAPWASLVQRLGRCARYSGESGQAIVTGAVPGDDKKAAPYELAELVASDDALSRLGVAGGDAGPKSLEAIEERWAEEEPSFLAKLYPYEPLHVLRRRDFDELFDTTPDLSGADLDVSRYIRSGEERDVSVFWRHVEDPKARDLHDVRAPAREELCPVPVGELRDFLKKQRGFVHDYVTGTWRRTDRVVPGMTVLLPAAVGGYDVRRGWDSKSSAAVVPVEVPTPPSAIEESAASADDDELSAFPWKSIATHGRETGEEAVAIAEALELPDSIVRVLDLAGRWHDTGKAHQVFQQAIADEPRRQAGDVGARRDLAKAPGSAWRKPPYPERPGFRHELASTLLLLELLRRSSPDHPALVGPYRELLVSIGQPVDEVTAEQRLESDPLAAEIASLSADEFDLLAYLVCAHHGKVRTSWSSTPRDQEAEHGGIHGICEGDRVASFPVSGGDRTRHPLPSLELSLACASLGLNGRYGRSWGERVARLVGRFGPFTLAYLEGIFRVADWRASQLPTPEDA